MLVRSGCDVVSVSRSGRPAPPPPPPRGRDSDAAEEEGAAAAAEDRVEWLAADAADGGDGGLLDLPSALGPIDAAVSCIGNARPSPSWDGFWGLHWDDAVMREENGAVNERAALAAREAGARRYAFVSVSYETAKAFEGPLEGYLDGKRAAERAAYDAFGDGGAFVVGPSLIYGGGRFAAAGRVLEAVLSSPLVSAYRAGGRALRSLSTSGEVEDWVEAVALTPPVDVDVVARAIAACAVGSIDANSLEPRRQGFFDVEGRPIDMVPVPFVDMADIRGVAASAGTDDALVAAVLRSGAGDGAQIATDAKPTKSSSDAPPLKGNSSTTNRKDPPFEGALVGSKPFLYPLPVAASLLLSFFWATNIDYPTPPPV